MKKIVLSLVVGFSILFGLSNNELELVLTAKAAEKKAVVLASMQLKGETKEKFGTLYDKYQEDLMLHRIQRLIIISKYAQNYNNMTDENADTVLRAWLTNEDSLAVLQKNYMAKFKKVMSSANVIRYFQIEHRLQLVNELKRAQIVPLVKPVAE